MMMMMMFITQGGEGRGKTPSTTVGVPHLAWSEARLAFGLKKRTVDERKTERDT